MSQFFTIGIKMENGALVFCRQDEQPSNQVAWDVEVECDLHDYPRPVHVRHPRVWVGPSLIKGSWSHLDQRSEDKLAHFINHNLRDEIDEAWEEQKHERTR